MPILTVSPSVGLSGPYIDSTVRQKWTSSLRPGRGLITQGEPEPMTSHVILNEGFSDWGDPVEVLDVEYSEVFDEPNALLADRRF